MGPYFVNLEVGSATSRAGATHSIRPSPARRKTTTINSTSSSLVPAGKRTRRSNGTEASASNGDAMEMDQPNGDSTNGLGRQASYPDHSAHRSPETEEPVSTTADPTNDVTMDVDDEEAAPAPPPPLLPRTHTKGTSRGIQSDPVPRLESITLDLPSGKTVDRLACSPRDAAVLATAGPSLCRIWNCASTDNVGPSSMPCLDIAGDHQESVYVSALEWSPTGSFLARATRDKGAMNKIGVLSVLNHKGQEFREMYVPHAIVLNLRWSPTERFLLAVAATGESSKGSIHLWEMSGDEQGVGVDTRITDAVWLNESHFTVCGEGILATYSIANGSLHLLEQYQEPDGRELWMHIIFDPITNMQAALDDENGNLAIIDKDGRMVKKIAHDNQVTAMEFQPLPRTSTHKMSARRILATASADCTVRLWNAQKPAKPHVFPMTPRVPALALAFSPDGQFLAAASAAHVQIWQANIEEKLVARWDAAIDKDVELSNGVNGHGEMNGTGVDGDSGYGDEGEEPLSLLSWAADSSKLFFSAGNKVTPRSRLLTVGRANVQGQITMLKLRRHAT